MREAKLLEVFFYYYLFISLFLYFFALMPGNKTQEIHLHVEKKNILIFFNPFFDKYCTFTCFLTPLDQGYIGEGRKILESLKALQKTTRFPSPRPLQLRRAAGPGAPRLSTCAGLQPGEVGETREGR